MCIHLEASVSITLAVTGRMAQPCIAFTCIHIQVKVNMIKQAETMQASSHNANKLTRCKQADTMQTSKDVKLPSAGLVQLLHQKLT